MKWINIALFPAIALTIGSGCIAATSVKSTRMYSQDSVVAVDGRVYVIDNRSGKAWEVDVSVAQPIEQRPTSLKRSGD